MEEKNDYNTTVDLEEFDAVTGCFSIIVTLLFFWIFVSHGIMRFQNPSMTETQLFLNLPKAFILAEPKWGMD